MFGTKLVIGTDNGPVEEAPRALDGVRVDGTAHPLVRRMIDPLVNGVLVPNAPIGAVRVGIDRLGVVCDDLAEKTVDALVTGVWHDANPQWPAPLDGTENDGLITHPLAGSLLSSREPVALTSD